MCARIAASKPYRQNNQPKISDTHRFSPMTDAINMGVCRQPTAKWLGKCPSPNRIPAIMYKKKIVI